MSEINTTPLVDVMLVLLIIFIVTAPLMTQSFQVSLPESESTAEEDLPEPINLEIMADGSLLWNSEVISIESVESRFIQLGKREEKIPVYILADKAVQFEYVAEVMDKAKKTGIENLAFKMLAE